MHGAVEAGWREADRILRDLNIEPLKDEGSSISLSCMATMLAFLLQFVNQ